jgi:hypothetical protein
VSEHNAAAMPLDQAHVLSPDVAAVNDSALGQPLAYIYVQAFGTTGSLVMWSFM